MHLPILPLQFVAVHLEADTFRLNNVKRPEVGTLLPASGFRPFHQIREEVERSERRRNPLTPRGGQSIGLQRGWLGIDMGKLRSALSRFVMRRKVCRMVRAVC